MAESNLFDALDDASPEELRQRLRSLQALLARAPVPIAITTDPSCRFIWANRALSTLIHMPQDANISLTPPPGTEAPYQIRQDGEVLSGDALPMQYAIAHRTSLSNEIEIVRPDGSVVNVQNDVEPLYDTHGNVYGCVSVCVDLTDRRMAEAALLEADRRKDEFLATLSHELRNPLAPIRTALEVMRLGHGDPDLVEKARATMERQLTHLVRITDDLLDVARITQNKVELRRERTDLRESLQSAVEATRSLIDAQEHVLTQEIPQTPIWVHADFTRLAQVFSNLLNNAAKYTEGAGKIHLTAAIDGAVVVVTVTDSGMGIPDEMMPRVFDMFTQLQAHRDRTLGGLGIGLTLAKRLVELHGGKIDAQSDGAGRGSTFRVTLPLASALEQDRSLDHPAASKRQPCRVLVAEDNADAAEMMCVMLSLGGHDVRVAPDGVEAVALAQVFAPQIAFLDIGMPRMDGYEAARRIRELLGPGVVLVALTGWGQDEDKRHAREMGFDHHLTKPPEPQRLERLIAECAEKSRA